MFCQKKGNRNAVSSAGKFPQVAMRELLRSFRNFQRCRLFGQWFGSVKIPTILALIVRVGTRVSTKTMTTV